VLRVPPRILARSAGNCQCLAGLLDAHQVTQLLRSHDQFSSSASVDIVPKQKAGFLVLEARGWIFSRGIRSSHAYQFRAHVWQSYTATCRDSPGETTSIS
jgi:hypothetical protein